MTQIPANGSSLSGISSAEALWILIMQQPRSTRRALTEKLLSSDMETAEQILLKNSIQRGWQQVKEMRYSGTHESTLQDLIDELRS